jgi:hypothetical protein
MAKRAEESTTAEDRQGRRGLEIDKSERQPAPEVGGLEMVNKPVAIY